MADDPRSNAPGERQLAILGALWSAGEATVLEVHQALADSGITASTVGTMLQKMERKELVAHRQEGRRYLYRATVSEPEVRRGMVGDLTRRLFGGDPVALLQHLVSEEEIGSSDLERLRREIERREGNAGEEPTAT